MKILLYAQVHLGLGHAARTVAIASLLERAGCSLTVALASPPELDLDVPVSVSVAYLPHAAPDHVSPSTIRARNGSAGSALLDRRSSALLELADALEPDWLVLEYFPFGRWQLASEILPVLYSLRHRRSTGALRIASSVRDILCWGPMFESRRSWVHETLRAFDRVLVHGDPNFCPNDAIEQLALPNALLRYTGYVARPTPKPSTNLEKALATARAAKARGARVVVAFAGGGGAGAELLSVSARTLGCFRDCDIVAMVIAGPLMPARDYARLSAICRDGQVVLVRSLPSITPLLALADACICQCGYNTAVEIMAANVPTVFVPFGAPDSEEQAARAARLSRGGRAWTLPPEQLSVERLARLMTCALEAPMLSAPRLPNFATPEVMLRALS